MTRKPAVQAFDREDGSQGGLREEHSPKLIAQWVGTKQTREKKVEENITTDDRQQTSSASVLESQLAMCFYIKEQQPGLGRLPNTW